MVIGVLISCLCAIVALIAHSFRSVLVTKIRILRRERVSGMTYFMNTRTPVLWEEPTDTDQIRKLMKTHDLMFRIASLGFVGALFIIILTFLFTVSI